MAPLVARGCRAAPLAVRPLTAAVVPARPPPARRLPAAPRASGPAPLAELEVRNFKGGEPAGSATLSLQVADDATATGLVHRYLVLLRQNARAGTASTLTRAEVRGGGRKPYAQKGTGNARMGSKRTPLRPGGGVVFGPKPRDWTIKMNKKERRLALATALQGAAQDVTVVDTLDGGDGKTKDLVAALAGLGADPMAKNVLLVADEVPEALARAARNIERLTLNAVTSLSAYDVLRADKIVVDTKALAHINEFYGPKLAEA